LPLSFLARLPTRHGSRDGLRHADQERAADLAYRMVYDVLARRIMYARQWEPELNIPWRDMVDELIHGAIAYLRHEPRS